MLLSTKVGSVRLRASVMTASGTAGRSNELSPYGRLDRLGAVVVKSVNAHGCGGNPAPRVAPLPGGVINSVGLHCPSVERWLQKDLPALIETGADVVASIWGSSVNEYAQAAEALASAPSQLVAVEVNLSCPNKVDSMTMFSYDPCLTHEVVAATSVCARPRWAKLSPAAADLTEIAAAAAAGGAEAVVLVNTMPGMVIDVEARRPLLGNTGGGVSGAALHPVAVRAVYDVRSNLPDLPIVGSGGVGSATDALELILAGASAVQVGTAIFADPRAPWQIQNELQKWCHKAGVTELNELIGVAHR